MNKQQTFSRETSQETVIISRSKVELEVVNSNLATFLFEDYEDHNFRLVLSYPQSREFLNKQDLKDKISEFSSLVLKTDQYALLFRVNYVSVGQLTDYYLISFNGNFSGVYLEVEITELVILLTTLLESYFTCVQENEFLPLYFEVDAQTVITPTSKSIGVPQAYDFSVTFREFMTNEAMWNIVDLSGIIDVVTNELEASTIERVIASVWEHSRSLFDTGNKVASEIFSSGSEVEAEIATEILSSNGVKTPMIARGVCVILWAWRPMIPAQLCRREMALISRMKRFRPKKSM